MFPKWKVKRNFMKKREYANFLTVLEKHSSRPREKHKTRKNFTNQNILIHCSKNIDLATHKITNKKKLIKRINRFMVFISKKKVFTKDSKHKRIAFKGPLLLSMSFWSRQASKSVVLGIRYAGLKMVKVTLCLWIVSLANSIKGKIREEKK